MKISDNGIILFCKKIQESLMLVKIFSESNGLCLGFAKNIPQKKLHNYQVGNLVKFQKFARTTDQLGIISCESIKSYQWHIMSSKLNLYGFSGISNIVLGCFEEYEPHNNSYKIIVAFLEELTNSDFSWLRYFQTEINLLKDAGYGLELDKCAVTHETENLLYVSPKSGRAVSKEAAKGYEHLLLKLPEFLVYQTEPENFEEIENAFKLSEYFFERYIWKEKGNPELIKFRDLLKSSYVRALDED